MSVGLNLKLNLFWLMPKRRNANYEASNVNT